MVRGGANFPVNWLHAGCLVSQVVFTKHYLIRVFWRIFAMKKIAAAAVAAMFMAGAG